MTLPRILLHGRTADTSMAARHPAPDEVEAPVSRPYQPTPYPHPAWDDEWTDRPPSTLADEVDAAQRAHEAWVATFTDEGVPADADVDVQPYQQPDAP